MGKTEGVARKRTVSVMRIQLKNGLVDERGKMVTIKICMPLSECYQKNNIEKESIEKRSGIEIEKNASHDHVSFDETIKSLNLFRNFHIFCGQFSYLHLFVCVFSQLIQSIPVHEALEYDGHMTQIVWRAIEGDMKVSFI